MHLLFYIVVTNSYFLAQTDTNWITSLSLFNYSLELHIDVVGHLIVADAFVTASNTFYVKTNHLVNKTWIYETTLYQGFSSDPSKLM